MKYNILTVANRSYYPFLDIFLNSLFKNTDITKLNKVYVVDVDLRGYKEKMYKSDKIVYLSDSLEDNFQGVHSDGWYSTTKLKTEYLRKVLDLIPEDEVMIMIDSDTLIFEDFDSVIDLNYDVQVTEMSEGSHVGASGVRISHIACFMSFNNIPKAKRFVDKWIENVNYLIENGKSKPHETPAMNMVLQDEEFMKDTSMQSLDDRIICSDLIIHPQTKILHFKSNGTTQTSPLENFLRRFRGVTCKDINRMTLDLSAYLNLESFNKWAIDDVNVSANSFYNIALKYKR